MTIECYYGQCRFHGDEGPFCFENKCKATKHELKLLGVLASARKATPAAWLTDRETMYFDKEDARRDCDGFIQPLYK